MSDNRKFAGLIKVKQKISAPPARKRHSSAQQAKTITAPKSNEFHVRQRENRLKRPQINLHGGVKLGTLEPLGIGRPWAQTGLDAMTFPTWLIPQGTGETAGSGGLLVSSREPPRTSTTVQLEGIEKIEVNLKVRSGVDMRHVWEHLGTPACLVRDFETLNSDHVGVATKIRLIVLPDPHKARVVRLRLFPIYQQIRWGHDVQKRPRFEALQDGEAYSYTRHPSEMPGQTSRSVIDTADGSGAVVRDLETAPDHILDEYTARFSTPDFPVRTSTQLVWVDDGTVRYSDLAEVVLPGDKPAIFEIGTGGNIRLR